eukprot:TRINITY_DN2593_c0_g1_i2.p1 TRINITY_DN2593_c0_g1~~TRINITY_DN2593_c0_g1_i2.p1  ORF type:complete len:716 (-),score=107.94 TRINITY_DN2593_c0_g1_i2:40-2187(-)
MDDGDDADMPLITSLTTPFTTPATPPPSSHSITPLPTTTTITTASATRTGPLLTTVTLSEHRVLPLVYSNPAVRRMHSIVVRMTHKQRLCFYGRVALRVVQGYAVVQGAVLSPNAAYTTLHSSYSACALSIEAYSAARRAELDIEQVHRTVKLQATDGDVDGNSDSDVDEEEDTQIADLVSQARHNEEESDGEKEEVVIVLRGVVKLAMTDRFVPHTLVNHPIVDRLYTNDQEEIARSYSTPLDTEETDNTNNNGNDNGCDVDSSDLTHQPSASEAQAQTQAKVPIQASGDQWFRIPGLYVLYKSLAPVFEPHHTFAAKLHKMIAKHTSESSAKPPAVLFCGSKNFGKSTYARHTVNALMNTYGSIAFLETDVGQSEFTPSGLISLHVVSSPVLGLPFNHLRTPDRAVFFGDTKMSEEPDYYFNAICYAYEAYLDLITKEKRCIPLVINTHGWVKGLGYTTLHRIICKLQPQYVVHLYPKVKGITYEAQNPIPFLAKEVSKLPYRPHVYPIRVRPFSPVRTPVDATDMRNFACVSYFGLQGQNLQTLPSVPPYRIHWSRLRFKVMGEGVNASYNMFAFNGSIVGLVADNNKYCVANQAILDEETADTMPSFLTSLSIADCIGLGIIRSIDMDKGFIYLLTPVPFVPLTNGPKQPRTLALVNTIVKGLTPLPVMIACQGGFSNTPYLTADSINEAGSAVLKARGTNLHRFRQTREQ